MIYDHLKNVHLYYGVHEDIKAGLQYLENLNPDVELGEYQINKNLKSIVSEYETAAVFERDYDVHQTCNRYSIPYYWT